MDNDKPLNGVSGWLLLFVILKFLSPVFFLISFFYMDSMLHRIARMRAAQHTTAPAIHAIPITPALHLALLVVTITTILVMLTGVIAAIGILIRARWALTSVALNLVLAAFSALMPFVQPGHLQPTVLYRTLLGLAVILFWFAYFYSSQRVRDTLGHNLFHPPPARNPIP
jgi:Protein of unknown function (DUF2569)